ncbi:MAG: MoaD/ThiS family protein [Chloroflexota bacterium]
MAKVRIEILPSLAETLGIDRTDEEIVADRDSDGEGSVRDILNLLSGRYRRFDQVVFDTGTQKLTGRVAIFLNGRTLGTGNGLSTELNDGDILTFVPVIEGG